MDISEETLVVAILARFTFVALFIAVSLGFASPAQAATTLTDNGDGTFTVVGPTGINGVKICGSNLTPSDCESAGSVSGLLYQIFDDGTYGFGSVVRIPGAGGGTVGLAAGTYTIVMSQDTAVFLRPFTVTAPTPQPPQPPQPQAVALSINTVDGSTCRQSSETGFAGTWVKLPGADDCTPPSSRAGSKLLGWATNPNFPVDIAQRQVTNGWGAYETFNDEGQPTGVFIPAGGSTYLSAAGNLFAIWSN